MMLRLRAKTAQGLLTLDSLSADNTVAELRSLLAEKLATDSCSVNMKCGFPPKIIPTSEDDKPLAEFLKSGDTIVVEQHSSVGKNEKSQSTGGIHVNGNTSSSVQNGGSGKMVRKVIPADNSCLFNSFSFCYSHGAETLFSPSDLRELIAMAVQQNHLKYPPEVLGSSVEDYQKFIRNSQSWGGGIEASILADHFELEVRVVDIQTNRIDKFGCNRNFAQCVYLLYDGIHYDALFGSDGTTVFPASDESIEDSCKDLSKKLKQSNCFTDLQNFSLRCMICNALLKGQTDAQKHAIATQHVNFREI